MKIGNSSSDIGLGFSNVVVLVELLKLFPTIYKLLSIVPGYSVSVVDVKLGRGIDGQGLFCLE